MIKPEGLPLGAGARIVVIGAGPAGSFFAHHAQRLARERDLSVSITLCDGKNFARQGPLGCNLCAGVISGPLASKLDHAGLLLPDERVQRHIEGYYFQTLTGAIELDHPDGKRLIRTVFRGNGPRFTTPGGNISFDDWLLDHVKSEGVTMVPKPVRDIVLPKDPAQPVRLFVGAGGQAEELEADLAVLAVGLNTAFLEGVRALGFGYEPPQCRRVCQAELPVGHDWIQDRLNNRIVVLAVRVGAVNMAILTPKAEYLTLTLMGDSDIKLSDLQEFLNHPAARAVLPPGWALPLHYCHCFPRLAVTPAKNPFTDRLVVIGDASFSRYYKNGIESAFVTAQLAAESAFRLGVSAASFAEGYLRPANRLIVRDNRYGRILLHLPRVVAQSTTWAETQRRILADSQPGFARQALRRGLWNILTGDAPYQRIFQQLYHPRLLFRLSIVLLASYFKTRRVPRRWGYRW